MYVSVSLLTIFPPPIGCVNEEDQLTTALQIVEDLLKWREEMVIDDLAAEEFPKRADFVKTWPHGFHGVSRDGHVVYIDRPGKMDPSYFAENFTMDEYMRMHIQVMEWMSEAKRRLSTKLEVPRYKHVVIFDLSGFGMSHFGSRVREPIKKLIGIDSSKYCETLHKMFIVNPSFMFRTIWVMVSPWLDESTKQRIHFLKDIKELQNHVDPDQLPDFLGGNVKYDDENPPFMGNLKTLATENNHDEIFHDLHANAIEKAAINNAKRQEILRKREEAAAVAADVAAEGTSKEGEDDVAALEKNVEALSISE